MATESPIRMPETSGKWAPHKKASVFVPSSANMAAEELKSILKGHRFNGSGKEVTPNRSGSAPPSMEGSFLAIENVLSQQNSANESMESLNISIGNYESEEQLRADPAYLAYYCSNVNLNPRLPPPLISWENRRIVRHIGGYGNNWGLNSVDDSGNLSLHLSQGALPTHKEEPEEDQSPQQNPTNWVDRASGVWPDQNTASLAGQRNFAADLSEEDSHRSASPVYDERRDGIAEESVDRDTGSSSLYNSPSSAANINMSRIRTGNTTPLNADLSPIPVPSSSSRDIGDRSCIDNVVSGMKALNITPPNLGIQASQSHTNFMINKTHHQYSNLYQSQIPKSQIPSPGSNMYVGMDQFLHSPGKFPSDVQPILQSSGFTPPLYATAAAYMTSTNPFFSNMQAPGLFSAPYVGGYTVNTNAFPPYVTGFPPPGTVPMVADGGAGPSYNPRTSVTEKFYGQPGFSMQSPFVDPMSMQFAQQPFGDPYGFPGPYDPKKGLENMGYEHRIPNPGNAPANFNPNPRRGGQMSPNYFVNTSNVGGVLMQYPTSPLPSPVFSGSPRTLGRAEMRFPLGSGPGSNTSIYGGWPGQRAFEGFEDPKIYNFLEELKSGKGRRFELSDITGHIVEFSSDQHGSRFIQQKLENCSAEEKAAVFREVLPHASRLMTDVFGNYVIQKFFEYGSHDQRKELANQLRGQILTLSLQMYGCRVIQKALEVIELEQKAQLVHELDGHVMRCVRDQNGNHVIQKCIESIPTEKIGFIISAFGGQVATLSMHPYGCRVIQRVLEHYTDEIQCQFIVDEIMESVCALAQDQYGNYVTQHVLERGKPQERRQIICKLSGHIVKLSQHKFASNVIEKCLEHGGPYEQELIINEIVGQTEGNDNLLTMMKDQFANYVVQKTLEICTDSQRIILLNRIRSHAHALKKYTYGKHIVARFEQVFGEENPPST